MAGDTRTEAIREYFLDNSGRAEPTDPNPLFAGRDKEIQSVLRAAAKLDRSNVPLANMTALLYGAPGAGKSELLTQLKARIEAIDTRPPIVILSGGANLLTEAAAVARAIHQQAPPDVAVRVAPLMTDTTWKAGFKGFVEAEWRSAAAPRSEVSRLGDVADCLKGAAGRAPTIVLLIDEAQDELRDASKRPDHFVRALHKGEAHLKALTVYGGLGNTPVELGAFGVTRLSENTTHLLLRLDDRDVRRMAVKALNATTRRTPGVIEQWAGTIVEYVQGWPMHLSHALQSVAERAHPNGWRLEREGFREAMRDAEEKRAGYYGQRLQRCSDLSRAQYTRWAGMFENAKEVDEHHVADALGVPVSDAKALTAQAVRAGLLEPVPEGGAYISPIPSLRDHIEARGRTFGGGTGRCGPSRPS